MKIRRRRSASPADPIKAATIDALNQVLEPLIELMLDAGVTVHEFNQLVRERAVRVAMKRLVAAGEKRSKSRASIMTGLSRSEITKLLRGSQSRLASASDELPAQRIMAAWNVDPRFFGKDGVPTTLPIFGKMPSFEILVEQYGGGIPIRAMLDELIQRDAIELLAGQHIKMRFGKPVSKRLASGSIAALGELIRGLLQTLAHNQQLPTNPIFEATVIRDVDDYSISQVRQGTAVLGAKFIDSATSMLDKWERKENTKKSPDNCRARRVGVTIFSFERELADAVSKVKKTKRKNFRRKIATGVELIEPNLGDHKLEPTDR